MTMEERSILKKSAKSVQAPHPTETASYPTVQDQTAQFQKLFDALPVAVILVDLKGYIQFMNRAAKSMLGEPDETLKLEEWPERFGFYLDDAVTYYPGEKFPLVRALQGETVDESEEMILRKGGDGPGNWISMSTDLVRDENGSVGGAIALIRDITYRKHIEFSREKQIQRIEALYKLSHVIAEAGNNLNEITRLAATFPSDVIGGMSIVSLLNDSKEKLKIAAFHDINPTGQALLRKFLFPDAEYDLSQGLEGGVVNSGEPLLIPLISPKQLEAISPPAFKEFINGVGIGSVLIVPLSGRSGVLGTIYLFRPADSKPFSTGDQSLLTDISYRIALSIENCRLFDSLREEIAKRLAAKRDLDMSEERFRSIFESVTLGIKVLDLEGTILQTNPAFQKMIGYTEEDFTGRHFHHFLYPDDVGRALMLFADVRNNGVSSSPFEHRTVHKDKSIVWARTFFTVVKTSGEDDAPAFITGIVENVTEQKRLESEMAELSNRLRNSMELERLRLAQELHDNPMQALYSANYRIEEIRTKTDPQVNEALKSVKDTILNVLRDLRATAKELRPPTIFSFGLENAIRSHVNDVLEKHPNINIHLSLAHDRQTLPEDVRLALFRILQQSLANVLRHADAGEVHVRFSFDAEEAHLEISDNGKGFNVPPNWIEFVRRGHYGLAGAAERVNALGGVLNVESRPGNGTTVRVTIPWKESAE